MEKIKIYGLNIEKKLYSYSKTEKKLAKLVLSSKKGYNSHLATVIHRVLHFYPISGYFTSFGLQSFKI